MSENPNISFTLEDFLEMDKIFPKENLDQLRKAIKDKDELLKEHGINFTKKADGRLVKYNCTKGPNKFFLTLVINGLDISDNGFHTIEDHFLNFEGYESDEDPKGKWESLPKDQRYEIFKKIFKCNNIDDIFPQQTSAVKLLEHSKKHTI